MENHSKYICPMHPEIVQENPGKCPKCGMDLVPVGESHGHQAHAGRSHEDHTHHGHGSMKEDEDKMHGHGHQGHADHTGMIDDFKKRFWDPAEEL